MTISDLARAGQLRGAALAHLKRYDEAKANYQAVLDREKECLARLDNDLYALPFIYCGLVEIAIAEKDGSAALGYLKKAKSFSGYEFESTLNWRIRKAEDDVRSLAVQVADE